MIEEEPKQDKRRKTLPKELEQLTKDNLMEVVKQLIQVILKGDGDDELNRLAEISTIGILNNPTPIALEQVGYKR